MKLSEIWISGQIFVSIPNVTVHIIRVTREGEATALPFMQQDSGLVMFQNVSASQAVHACFSLTCRFDFRQVCVGDLQLNCTD